MSVISSVSLPSRAGATNQIENLAWLDWWMRLPFIVQSIHEVFQDVECRESSHATAVEGQQAESGGIERIGLSM
jgi:hypothetical protein